jgi:hypothetical protein
LQPLLIMGGFLAGWWFYGYRHTAKHLD